MLDVRVKMGAELSTDHHLQRTSEETRTSYQIKCEALVDKDVRKTFEDSVPSWF